jgi:GNAT superfamily N-acetyltransferase
MITGLNVRTATASDLDTLAQLRTQMDAEDGVAAPDGFRDHFIRWFQRHGDRFTVLVAEHDHRIVGTIWLERVERVPRPSEICPSAVGYVTFMFVTEAYRNRGVGTAMLNRLRLEARDEGCEVLVVWPSDRSVPLYVRNGFARPPGLLELRLPRRHG